MSAMSLLQEESEEDVFGETRRKKQERRKKEYFEPYMNSDVDVGLCMRH